MDTRITLDEATDLTRSGDIWLFRGQSAADRAIQLGTNSPVNHVGMAIVLEDLPPLLWHAELGRSLPDMWTGNHHRGVQLHDLGDAVRTWSQRYGQRVWLRQLDHPVTKEQEDAVLRVVARLDGTPFPSTARMASRWLGGRIPSLRRGRRKAERPEQPERSGQSGQSGQPEQSELESAYCAEVVAVTYEAMGLLRSGRRVNWYDPGRFWSGDDLGLGRGARLGEEIAVDVPARDALA